MFKNSYILRRPQAFDKIFYLYFTLLIKFNTVWVDFFKCFWPSPNILTYELYNKPYT